MTRAVLGRSSQFVSPFLSTSSGGRRPSRSARARTPNNRRPSRASQCPGLWNFCRRRRFPVAGSGREAAPRPRAGGGRPEGRRSEAARSTGSARRRRRRQRPRGLALRARRALRGPGRAARTHRLLVIGGEPGWRAALAVVLSRAAGVETSASIADGLNDMLRFRPTCVVLNVKRSTAEAGRFLGALSAQLPACPVLVVCDDVYLGAAPVWESLNIRGVLRPPVRFEDLVDRIGAVLPPGDSLSDPWPRLGESVGRTIDHLSRHYDEDLTVDGIAAITDISASHLAHRFRSELGMSVRDYLTRVRVTIAQDLLAHPDEKLESIAARLGFADTSHLAHVFQRITRRPPNVYRGAAR